MALGSNAMQIIQKCTPVYSFYLCVFVTYSLLKQSMTRYFSFAITKQIMNQTTFLLVKHKSICRQWNFHGIFKCWNTFEVPARPRLSQGLHYIDQITFHQTLINVELKRMQFGKINVTIANNVSLALSSLLPKLELRLYARHLSLFKI